MNLVRARCGPVKIEPQTHSNSQSRVYFVPHGMGIPSQIPSQTPSQTLAQMRSVSTLNPAGWVVL